jgi:hypothetical protein
VSIDRSRFSLRHTEGGIIAKRCCASVELATGKALKPTSKRFDTLRLDVGNVTYRGLARFCHVIFTGPPPGETWIPKWIDTSNVA